MASFISALSRLLLLTAALNLVRYLIGGPIEEATIMTPMHVMIPRFAAVFDMDFNRTDYLISLAYNYVLWFAAALQFHLMQPSLKGAMVVRSLVSFGISGLAFIGLAAVYMNHFTDELKVFFAWSMIDAAILFSLVGLANGFLYPVFFKSRRAPTIERET